MASESSLELSVSRSMVAPTELLLSSHVQASDAPDNNCVEPTKPQRPQPAEDPWTALQRLTGMMAAGLIDEAVFHKRRQLLVDRLTGTSFAPAPLKRKKPTRIAVKNPYPVSLPKPPPDFSKLPSERAVQHWFDVDAGGWKRSVVEVKMAPEPFARGSLRLAYHITGLAAAEDKTSYVAKISIDPFESRTSYFQDVAMQLYAREYACKYNSYNPPKPVKFIKAWIVELTSRPNHPLVNVERFIDGPYRKHNNNFGYVSEDERNTPQAFSHFTYEASKHKILICDVQGVGDCYTDPQFHTHDGKGFGKGNMGERGFRKFLQTHRCNAICRYLKLPSVNPMEDGQGTVPASRVMDHKEVEVIRMVFSNPATLPLLPPRNDHKTQNSWCSCACSCSVL